MCLFSICSRALPYAYVLFACHLLLLLLWTLFCVLWCVSVSMSVCACAPATAFNVVLCRIIGVHLAKTIATIHCTAVNAARSQHTNNNAKHTHSSRTVQSVLCVKEKEIRQCRIHSNISSISFTSIHPSVALRSLKCNRKAKMTHATRIYNKHSKFPIIIYCVVFRVWVPRQA